jgi:hypothetical protein
VPTALRIRFRKISNMVRNADYPIYID